MSRFSEKGEEEKAEKSQGVQVPELSEANDHALVSCFGLSPVGA